MTFIKLGFLKFRQAFPYIHNSVWLKLEYILIYSWEPCKKQA